MTKARTQIGSTIHTHIVVTLLCTTAKEIQVRIGVHHFDQDHIFSFIGRDYQWHEIGGPLILCHTSASPTS